MTDNGQLIANEHEIKRSPEWPKIERQHLKDYPECKVCGTTECVQVHHIFPFHYCVALGRPDLELDERNLVTLCESEKGKEENNHHLLIGHLNDFKSSNLNVIEDAEKYKNKTLNEIKEDQDWLIEEKKKLTPLEKMTDEEKKNLRDLMDTTFPRNSK